MACIGHLFHPFCKGGVDVDGGSYVDVLEGKGAKATNHGHPIVRCWCHVWQSCAVCDWQHHAKWHGSKLFWNIMAPRCTRRYTSIVELLGSCKNNIQGTSRDFMCFGLVIAAEIILHLLFRVHKHERERERGRNVIRSKIITLLLLYLLFSLCVLVDNINSQKIIFLLDRTLLLLLLD